MMTFPDEKRGRLEWYRGGGVGAELW